MQVFRHNANLLATTFPYGGELGASMSISMGYSSATLLPPSAPPVSSSGGGSSTTDGEEAWLPPSDVSESHGGTLELTYWYDYDKVKHGPSPVLKEIVFAADDLDAAETHMSNVGAAYEREGDRLVVRDPDGYKLVLLRRRRQEEEEESAALTEE
eukprot:GHVU01080659.1.p2 GENE.GHVU01080659.1~~GHVU01080659.1.p2  ORF type:complete len:155 (-),score=41.50 GHVU01080659.1:513-977(-)